MQFQKNSSNSQSNRIFKLLIKVIAIFLILFLLVVLVDKIEFPSPNKKIEIIIPNENFKIIK